MAQERFDLQIVLHNFEKCLKDPNDVLTDFYLDGFRELYKYVLKFNSYFKSFKFTVYKYIYLLYKYISLLQMHIFFF